MSRNSRLNKFFLNCCCLLYLAFYIASISSLMRWKDNVFAFEKFLYINTYIIDHYYITSHITSVACNCIYLSIIVNNLLSLHFFYCVHNNNCPIDLYNRDLQTTTVLFTRIVSLHRTDWILSELLLNCLAYYIVC